MTEEAFAKIKSDVEYCGEIGFEAELLAHIQQQDERISGYLTDIAILKKSNVGLMRELLKLEASIVYLKELNEENIDANAKKADRIAKQTEIMKIADKQYQGVIAGLREQIADLQEQSDADD